MRLEVASELWPFLSLHIVYLCKRAVPEESEGLATVDPLDVHAQRHYDLVVSIRGGLVLQAHFHCFV